MGDDMNDLTLAQDALPGMHHRRFDLRPGDLLLINTREYTVERRLDSRIQLLELATKDVQFKSDEEIAFLSSQGKLQWMYGRERFGRLRGPLPNRLALTVAQKATAS